MAWTPFPEDSERKIVEAIRSAEKQFSGELRVHVERYCKSNPYARARNVFNELGMANTILRNGVLIFLGIEDRKFAILGDLELHQRVPEGFWDLVKGEMLKHFEKNELVEGICRGIELSAEQLSIHFPPRSDDQNELPDEISYGS